MKKFQNLLADLNKFQGDVVAIDWIIAKLEPLIEEAIRVEKGREAHIRGVDNKNEKLQKQMEKMQWAVDKVRAVVPFCPRCDQPYCGMTCR